MDALQQVGNLLKKDTVVWPYQKMDINEFWRRYFPESATSKEIEKYKGLPPDKLLKSVENKLRTIDAILKPLEDNMKALEFQQRLLTYLSIYAPNKLKECQKTLSNSPREIRESFTSEKNLELANKIGSFSQKAVAELMALWLNMRYYGALSGGLSPKFLLIAIKDEDTLKAKLAGIEETLNNIRPNVEGKHTEYSTWVLKKQRIDEERKAMTFGPESIQTLEVALDSVYLLSINGEISQEDALKVVDLAKIIIDEAIKVGEADKKTLISKEKREKLEKIITEIKNKPRLFFTIAQISKLLEKGEPLTEEHIATLYKVQNVVALLPPKTVDALQNEELKKNLQIIFEPLKFSQPDAGKKVPEKKDKGKKSKKKKGAEEPPSEEVKPQNYFEILEQIFDDTAKWYLNRIIEEEKSGLENLLDLFNGIPMGLGNHIALLITKKVVKLDIDGFKERLIGYLSKFGVYELYTQIGKLGRKEEAEIQVADEINIPPQADQRLAPMQKQIKFEFMKYMETAKLKGTPVFNILEINQIAPIKFVDLLLEKSQSTLINVINANVDHKLHQLMKLEPTEFEVKLKTLNLKLSSLMKSFSDLLEKLFAEELKEPKFRESEVLEKFNTGIEDVWLKSLIETKKIEPKVVEPTTDKVSALAAQLEGGIKRIMDGPRAGPPSAVGPPSAIKPPSGAAPPSARPGPPSAVGPPSTGAAPPSARPGPPSAVGLPSAGAPSSGVILLPGRPGPPSAVEPPGNADPSQVPNLGPGQGPGRSPGKGPGQGPGLGPGEGLGKGSGPGPGPGLGPGRGPGEGPGKGPGKGQGKGPGKGPGLGPGQGLGLGPGPGLGAGQGPGQGPGLGVGQGPGQGPGLGPGQGPGQGAGQGPGLGPGQGPGQGAGQGPGLGSGQGPGQGPSTLGKVYVITKNIAPPKAKKRRVKSKKQTIDSATEGEIESVEEDISEGAVASEFESERGVRATSAKVMKKLEKIISSEMVSVPLDQSKGRSSPQEIMPEELEESPKVLTKPGKIITSEMVPVPLDQSKGRLSPQEITPEKLEKRPKVLTKPGKVISSEVVSVPLNQSEGSGQTPSLAVPGFVKTGKPTGASIAVKAVKLKETIEEVMHMVESSMAEIDQLSPEVLKNALQLVYRLRELEKMDTRTIDPSEIRKLTDLAEALKTNKNMIVVQKEKLKKLETKLSEKALIALDTRLELIAKIFDEFIKDLELAISQLSEKGEKLIEFFGKKGGKEFRDRQRIRKEGKLLASNVSILAKIGELAPKEFEKAKQLFIAFQKARTTSKGALIKQYSQEFVDLIKIDRDEFLKFTRDPNLLASLQHLFKIV